MTSVNLPENYDLNMHYSQTILPTCGGKNGYIDRYSDGMSSVGRT